MNESIDLAADNIAETFGLTTNEQRAEIRELLSPVRERMAGLERELAEAKADNALNAEHAKALMAEIAEANARAEQYRKDVLLKADAYRADLWRGRCKEAQRCIGNLLRFVENDNHDMGDLTGSCVPMSEHREALAARDAGKDE